MIYAKIQPQSFLVLKKKIFKCCLPYMGMAAILFSSTKLFKQIISSTWRKTPCEIWWKLASGFTEVV